MPDTVAPEVTPPTAPPPPAPRPMSLRAYAKSRKARGLAGATHKAVQVAIEDGRLERSVVMYRGKPAIGDPALADAEWGARTRPRIDNAPTVAASPRAAASDDEQDLDDFLPYDEARRRREIELWRQARVKREVDELELAKRRGELVTASEVADAYVEAVTAAKTKLLGVPTRARQRIPHLTADDVREIEGFIREALEELAAKGQLAAGAAPDEGDGD